jgi:RHS repeat-associated protein
LTAALADGTGNATTLYTYEPFGNTSVSGAASTSSFQYTGRENDGTGLYFYRARYYQPILQRFISQDPIGFQGGDVNLYAYAMNSPTNFFDSSGLTRQTNGDFFWDWALGTRYGGGRYRNYGPNDIETQEMEESYGATALRKKFYQKGCQSFAHFSYGTFQAYWDTIREPIHS